MIDDECTPQRDIYGRRAAQQDLVGSEVAYISLACFLGDHGQAEKKQSTTTGRCGTWTGLRSDGFRRTALASGPIICDDDEGDLA